MRIIAGKFKGRSLHAPGSLAVRPTSDRMRESLFNILAHTFDDAVDGARVLDLFAGTGALGIEALSRGADFCLFVDIGVEARGLIRDNVEALGLTGATKIFKRDATSLGANRTPQPFDLAFCDPPYNKGLAEQALNSAADGGWLKDGALIVVEEEKAAPKNFGNAFKLLAIRDAGDSRLHFLKFDRGLIRN